jgi:hypothetical protein
MSVIFVIVCGLFCRSESMHIFIVFFICIVIWDPIIKRWGDLFKEVQFIWNVLWQYKKRRTFNTDDCLIEVTVREMLLGFVVVFFIILYVYNTNMSTMSHKRSRKMCHLIRMKIFPFYYFEFSCLLVPFLAHLTQSELLPLFRFTSKLQGR